MTLPGLETSHPNGQLFAQAVQHIERLRSSGLLVPALELRAALVLELAQRITRAPAYAVAPLAAQLQDAIDALPEQGGDAWDALIAALNAGDYCPNCQCPTCSSSSYAR